MSDPRFQPRQMAVPADRHNFGKTRVLNWLEGTTSQEVTRIDAARIQHALALKIVAGIRAKGMSIRDYAAQTGSGYDRMAKMLRGEAIMRLEDVADAERLLGGFLQFFLIEAPRRGTVIVEDLKDTTEYGALAMAQRLIGALDTKTVADLLAVGEDLPGRWASGQDAPEEAYRAQLADLDALIGHLLSAFTPAQARLWLGGHDAGLGARPIDVFRLAGAAPVIEAIRAHRQGTFI